MPDLVLFMCYVCVMHSKAPISYALCNKQIGSLVSVAEVQCFCCASYSLCWPSRVWVMKFIPTECGATINRFLKLHAQKCNSLEVSPIVLLTCRCRKKATGTKKEHPLFSPALEKESLLAVRLAHCGGRSVHRIRKRCTTYARHESGE